MYQPNRESLVCQACKRITTLKSAVLSKLHTHWQCIKNISTCGHVHNRRIIAKPKHCLKFCATSHAVAAAVKGVRCGRLVGFEMRGSGFAALGHSSAQLDAAVSAMHLYYSRRSCLHSKEPRAKGSDIIEDNEAERQV